MNPHRPSGSKFARGRHSVRRFSRSREDGRREAGRREAERREDGFTLLELMIVVIIIGLAAMLAAPTIGTAMAERRTSEATLDLVRLLRAARSSAAGYGRAHLARYAAGAAGGLGTIEMYRGINNGCNANNWAAITAGGCNGNAACRQWLNMTDYTRGTHTVVMASVGGFDDLDICFEPTGITRWRVNVADRFLDLNIAPNGTNLRGGFVFSFQRQVGGANAGVLRRVLLPLGGDARVLR